MRLVLVIALFYQIGSFLAHEGSECKLENGQKGVCISVLRCPSKLKEVQEGKRWWESPERCGFDNFTEIICCADELPPRIQLRPAAMACQEYRKQYYKDPKTQQKTLNENEAQDAEFPYVVDLGYNYINADGVLQIRYFCSGTLISDEYVLTAATCVNMSGYFVPVEVRLGDREPNSTDGVRIPIEKITVHPQYTPLMAYHDLAIIKLKTKAQMTHNIKPVCLRTQPLSTVSLSLATFLLVIDWGDASIHSEASNKLMGFDFGIVDSEQCYKWYKDFRSQLPDGILNSQVCAKSKGFVGADACLHRSGSPLLMTTDSEDTLVGVTSFGRYCGDLYPVVCTAIYFHLDWIEEKVWPSLNRISPMKNITDEDVLLVQE